MIQIIPIVMSIVGALTYFASAGPIYEVTYTKDKKERKHEIVLGGMLAGGMIVAYSEKTDKFYSIFYKYSDGKPKPELKVWDTKAGKHISLYRFKETDELLMSIEKIEDIKFLPKVKDIKTKYVGDAD